MRPSATRTSGRWFVGAKLTAGIARGVSAKRLSRFLASRRILLDTAVGREIEWLILTELLELPFRQGYRIARKDALAETILIAGPGAGRLTIYGVALLSGGDRVPLRRPSAPGNLISGDAGPA